VASEEGIKAQTPKKAKKDTLAAEEIVLAGDAFFGLLTGCECQATRQGARYDMAVGP